MSIDRRYIRYKFTTELGEFKDGDVKDGEELADAFAFFPIRYDKLGEIAIRSHAVDGRTAAPLCDTEMFKVWALLGARLAKSDELKEKMPHKTKIAAEAFHQWSKTDSVMQGIASKPVDKWTLEDAIEWLKLGQKLPPEVRRTLRRLKDLTEST